MGMKSQQLLLFILLGIISCHKPEMGTNKKSVWIKNALHSISSNEFPRIKAISWWHENFDRSQLRIDSSPESIAAYKTGIAAPEFISTPRFDHQKLIAPTVGIYHAAFPDFGGTEDIVSSERIEEFESLAGKEISWAYFSNNWYAAIEFPAQAVNTIINAGKTPFIRMMPRSNFDEGGPDPIYTMQKIIDGDFDTAFTQWAIHAKNTGKPLLVEFGTEVNGNWFPWNGQFNGAGETTYGLPALADGPERFKDAYRHIIDIFNENGVNNITWFFHIDAYGEPTTDWNKISHYYPGDEYIDWLGVSIYGPQEKGETYQEFTEIMNDIYPQLIHLSEKPIAVLEFAITELE